MKIYIPYFDSAWRIQEAESQNARKLGRYWAANGTIYGPTAYTTREGAEAYIEKNYSRAAQLEYLPA